MTDHVVSLEIAKKMDEAGWEKKTEFYWRVGRITKQAIVVSWEHLDNVNQYDWIKAPLATEILEELSNDDIHMYLVKEILSNKGQYDLFRSPDKLAKVWLWLHLKQEGLLK